MHPDDRDQSASPPPGRAGEDKAFLGAEFVTWVFFHLDENGWVLELPELRERLGIGLQSTVSFAAGDRMALRALDGTGTRVTLAGPDLDDSAELLQAVRRGALLEAFELQVWIGERVYKFTLRADGGLSGVKLADVLKPGSEDDVSDGEAIGGASADGADGQAGSPRRRRQGPDAADVLTLRMACLDDVEAVIDALFNRFVTRRVARAWPTADVSSIKKRVDDRLRERLGRG